MNILTGLGVDIACRSTVSSAPIGSRCKASHHQWLFHPSLIRVGEIHGRRMASGCRMTSCVYYSTSSYISTRTFRSGDKNVNSARTVERKGWFIPIQISRRIRWRSNAQQRPSTWVLMQTNASSLHIFQHLFLYLFSYTFHLLLFISASITARKLTLHHGIHSRSWSRQTLAEPQWSKSTFFFLFFYQEQRLDTNDSHFFIAQTPFHPFILPITAAALIMTCRHTVLSYKQEMAQGCSMTLIWI